LAEQDVLNAISALSDQVSALHDISTTDVSNTLNTIFIDSDSIHMGRGTGSVQYDGTLSKKQVVLWIGLFFVVGIKLM
jgi:hypothetical protein